ncbi:hypothetical protein [Nostoc sp. 'Peltigera membranacea cyanobiont' 232]|uniref:hypothetical protein n=1 Tax=Nostoc sp. 'Peltigera membranacea cyanobiont' 232 TaxID=2014531 RepID=UPI000B956D3F|nr:hypothetical protein [Nostoc sp. 'Peltigera membranacea cyanobiont' 232]OYE04377.1 hypothetical protein CDG79_13550 [Nostoc sp. 'Peltigera membranacea cyanobiont' 232]
MQSTTKEQFFTEISAEEAANINGGFSFPWMELAQYTFKELIKYNTRMAPYRNANGRTTTSYDPYDKPRLVIVSGTGQYSK